MLWLTHFSLPQVPYSWDLLRYFKKSLPSFSHAHTNLVLLPVLSYYAHSLMQMLDLPENCPMPQ